MNEETLALAGYQKVYDYTQYSHEHNVNVIPEKDFKRLVHDTFTDIANTLRKTYGPYASTVLLSDVMETTATKDGYNVFNSLKFSHPYKRLVYKSVFEIINAVNERVGDGTTSCVLLAEKMFTELNKTMVDEEHCRQTLSVLGDIENHIRDKKYVEKNLEDGIVEPLRAETLKNLIKVASNYDEKLTQIIYDALDCKVNSDNVVQSMSNVVVDDALDRDTMRVSTSYEIERLPGNYHITAKLVNQDFLPTFDNPVKMRVVLFDHSFNDTDWNMFMYNFTDDVNTVIIAREYSETVLKRQLHDYAATHSGRGKKNIHIFPFIMKSNYFKDDIQDLAAVLGQKVQTFHSGHVIHDILNDVQMQLIDGNTLCFTIDALPLDYIEKLRTEMNNDISGSMMANGVYKARLHALQCDANDTIIKVRSASPMELKMIVDKIEDCISIANSALQYGVIPNLFTYGYWRINTYQEQYKDDPIVESVCNAIKVAITGLFDDIFKSKHLNKFEEKREVIKKQIYSLPTTSFDIIKEAYTPIEEFPTSSQYDLEVISATIEIVKYLLTSRAMIFDAQLLKPVDDTGHYQLIGG